MKLQRPSISESVINFFWLSGCRRAFWIWLYCRKHS